MMWHTRLDAILAEVRSLPEVRRFAYPIRHGTMRAGVYAPHAIDDQQPHPQDELYVIASGSGVFVKEGVRKEFRAQDILFVEAGSDHRFEQFTPDFVAWVIFWGPDGGEAQMAESVA